MTPAEKAAEIVADPAWRFASDPTNAVVHASTRAAQADAEARIDDARFWTHAACLLVEAAASPQFDRGHVLAGLVDRYGEPA